MRPRRLSAAAIVLGSLLFAASATAQDPVPPPPEVEVPIPEEALPTDTIPREELEDTAAVDPRAAAAVLPAFPRAGRPGFDRQIWEWDREALRAYHGFSLYDLLDRIPGLTLTRAGGVGAPVGISAFGAGGGRVRIFIDGLEIDPAHRPVPDVGMLLLVDIGHLRVTRAPDQILIEIDRWRPISDVPFTEVEAGTGDFRSRILNAYFTRPLGEANQITAGFGLADTQGFARQQPYTMSGGFLRVDHRFSDRWTAQAEYRQRGEDRREVFPLRSDRREFVLRARGRPIDRVALDAQVAQLRWRDRSDAAAPDDSLGITLPSFTTTQIVGRGAWRGSLAWIQSEGRWRPRSEGPFASRVDWRFAAGAGGPTVRVDGSASGMRRGERSGMRFEAGGSVSPAAGIDLFARAGRGGVPVGLFVGEAETDEELSAERRARFASGGADWLRTGATVWLWGGQVQGAFWSAEPDTVAPFGLAFDEDAAAMAGRRIHGYELAGRMPLFTRRALIEWGWSQPAGSTPALYQPAHELRLALNLHGLFREGNLEPDFWLEAFSRGWTQVPQTAGDGSAVLLDPYWTMRASLQLRIIDVRAFALVENIFYADDLVDVPGFRRTPFLRATFGARWQFFD